MQDEERIGLFSARFVSANTEKAFQEASLSRDRRLNKYGVAIGLILYAAYGIYDLSYFDDPHVALSLRGFVTFAVIALLATPSFHQTPDRHQKAITICLLLMSLSLVAIIGFQPALNNKHYIGLIQGAVLFGFVLRINFPSILLVFGSSFVAFIVAVAHMADRQEVILRSVTLFSFTLICSVGVYLLQRYHRRDFLQSRVIDEQNRQLTKMLDDVRLDNDRKLAAMNLLVHFVRTPVHQISGFTDIVLQQLRDEDLRAKPQDVASSAQYIKDASTSLTNNVTQLLDYHRLDEIERRETPERVQLKDIFNDACEKIDEARLTVVATADPVINSLEDPLRLAMRCVSGFVSKQIAESGKVEASLSTTEQNGAEITFTVIGGDLSAQTFEEHSKPLTEISSYLNANGASMPMALRTIARVAAICGGHFSYAATAGGYALKLRLPNMPQAALAEGKVSHG